MTVELSPEHQQIAEEARERICACIAGQAVDVVLQDN